MHSSSATDARAHGPGMLSGPVRPAEAPGFDHHELSFRVAKEQDSLVAVNSLEGLAHPCRVLIKAVVGWDSPMGQLRKFPVSRK